MSSHGFFENLPLRDGEAFEVRLADGTTQDVRSVTNTVADAMGIQDYLERMEWVMQSASPVRYAPYVRGTPLPGIHPKRVIIQFAKGDQTVPNPATTAMIRAGGLSDRATFYRQDLTFAENPALLKDPHGFMPVIRAFGAIAQGAQEQIVVFFDSDGQFLVPADADEGESDSHPSGDAANLRCRRGERRSDKGDSVNCESQQALHSAYRPFGTHRHTQRREVVWRDGEPASRSPPAARQPGWSGCPPREAVPPGAAGG